jgi:hypothetical protein
VKDAGITQALADLVPKELPAMPPAEQKDRVAFRTGVVFAYTLLGGRTSPKPQFLAELHTLRDGMAGIGTGQGLLNRMDKAIEQVENDTASRDDFLAELDGMITSAVPEEGWGPDDHTGPLLQAGAWLAGMNVVAQAVVRAGDAAAADKLLRHPEVAAFFLRYIKGEEGAAKAGSVSGVLVETLAKLQTVSSQPAIGIDGAKATVEATQKLLGMF